MPTQTRVPGAASSEVDFELERFERAADDRIEISGRWYGLRGRRFVRPVLNLSVGGTRRRAIALLEHKPWAADDGKTWMAAFRCPDGAGDIESAELELGPGLVVELPAPGGKTTAAVRMSSLRPDATPGVRFGSTDEDEDAERPDASQPAGRGRPVPSAGDRRPGAAASTAGDAGRPAPSARHRRAGAAASTAGERSTTERATAGERGAWAAAATAPARPPRERAPAPPRDVLTAAHAERDEAIAARDEAERERLIALSDRDDALSRRDAALRDVGRAVAERDEAIAERDRLATELERVTRERDIAHAERNRTLQDAEAVARERDQAAAERDAARSELSRALPAREEAIRARDAEAARADQAESERDTAFAERKSAVAQRDRARRERDRAMRAAGVDPPSESPHVAAGVPRGRRASAAGDDAADRPEPSAGAADAPPAATPPAGATPPGTPLPSRPVKRIGAGPPGPAPEPKPLLTPVDAGRPRRLSRTRRPPSAPARWAVRIIVVLLLLSIAVVLAMLLGSTL